MTYTYGEGIEGDLAAKDEVAGLVKITSPEAGNPAEIYTEDTLCDDGVKYYQINDENLVVGTSAIADPEHSVVVAHGIDDYPCEKVNVIVYRVVG